MEYTARTANVVPGLIRVIFENYLSLDRLKTKTSWSRSVRAYGPGGLRDDNLIWSFGGFCLLHVEQGTGYDDRLGFQHHKQKHHLILYPLWRPGLGPRMIFGD